MLSVTDSSVPIVFCEGLKDGLDPVFLHQIIPPGQASNRPVGGKLSMRAFIEGYLTDYNQPNYVGFRDRDFDVQTGATLARNPDNLDERGKWSSADFTGL